MAYNLFSIQLIISTITICMGEIITISNVLMNTFPDDVPVPDVTAMYGTTSINFYWSDMLELEYAKSAKFLPCVLDDKTNNWICYSQDESFDDFLVQVHMPLPCRQITQNEIHFKIINTADSKGIIGASQSFEFDEMDAKYVRLLCNQPKYMDGVVIFVFMAFTICLFCICVSMKNNNSDIYIIKSRGMAITYKKLKKDKAKKIVKKSHLRTITEGEQLLATDDCDEQNCNVHDADIEGEALNHF